MEQPTYQIRQGDLLLIRVPELPASTARAATLGNHLLALGEVTGHAHYVREQEAYAMDPDERMRRIAQEWGVADPRALVACVRVTAEAGATLYHGTPTSAPAGPTDADHAFLHLPAGDYLVLTPREYTGEDEDWVRIAD